MCASQFPTYLQNMLMDGGLYNNKVTCIWGSEGSERSIVLVKHQWQLYNTRTYGHLHTTQVTYSDKCRQDDDLKANWICCPFIDQLFLNLLSSWRSSDTDVDSSSNAKWICLPRKCNRTSFHFQKPYQIRTNGHHRCTCKSDVLIFHDGEAQKKNGFQFHNIISSPYMVTQY